MEFGCTFSIALLAIIEFWHLSPSCSQMHISFLLFPYFLQILLKSFFMNRAKVSPVILSYERHHTTPFPYAMHTIRRTYFPPVPHALPLAVTVRPSLFFLQQRPPGADACSLGFRLYTKLQASR